MFTNIIYAANMIFKLAVCCFWGKMDKKIWMTSNCNIWIHTPGSKSVGENVRVSESASASANASASASESEWDWEWKWKWK